jgi:hypothetical protein
MGTSPSGPTGPAQTPHQVIDFLELLGSPDFSILAPVSEAEAEEAITLFSVSSVLLAGKSERQVGPERRTDVLGVLTLYYGLQDRSLIQRLPVRSQDLWTQVEDRLKFLRDELDRLGPDVGFLEREARRQFNLGRNNGVIGNTDFPRLFRRYVEIANDPLMFLDLRVEQSSPLSDKQKVAQAFDLLRELKDVVVRTVRSLSKYGTFATTRANKDWAGFQRDALDVLKLASSARLTDDLDEQRPLMVLAALTGKNLDTQIAPYVALAREGGELLRLALEAYRAAKDRLEDYDEAHLLDVFQAQGAPFLTTRMRRNAAILRSFPLREWT